MATPQPKKTTAGIPATIISAQADELGELEKFFAPHAPKLARIEQLRKAIRAHFDFSAAGDSFETRGDRFIVAVGARANERTINPAKLIKAIGLKLYASIARTPTLAALEAHVPCDICAGVITTAQSGTRPLKTFEIGKAA